MSGWSPGTGGAGPISEFTPGQAAAPTSTVELSISCADLADMDVFSKSDPFCVLYMKDGDRWLLVDKTETIDNTLNPIFEKKFVLQFRFEERQLLRLSVFDQDGPSSKLDDHDFIGATECSLGEVVSQQGKGLTRHLEGDGNTRSNVKQTITIIAEELISSKEVLKLSALCNADHNRTLRFSVDDWNANGSHSHIGEFDTCVSDLLGGQPEYPLVSKKKKQKKGEKYKNSGFLLVNSCQIELQPTFLDFISGGTELSFTVAIDFTASNGSPQDPRSLHYNDPTGAPNQYVTAIRAVGSIVQDYDTDRMFPALGFGARIPPDGRVSHEFFLNLQENPYCEGVDGILAAYYQSLNAVQLYGPTNFSPVINHVAKFARAFQDDPSNYFVLLVITDGVITDLDATKNAIIAASCLPLSIIIVGVGAEDFSAMDELDSDDSLLSNNGLTAERDIVQFVEMQRFVRGTGSHITWNREMLAKEVLAEIPDQLVGYMKKKGFQPPGKTGSTYPNIPTNLRQYAPAAPPL